MPLPKVSIEIAGPIGHSYATDRELMSRTMKRLEQENPVLAEFIETAARGSECYRTVAQAGLMVYLFLESQQAANELSGEIGKKL